MTCLLAARKQQLQPLLLPLLLLLVPLNDYFKTNYY
jgi:hypothetical protein